MVPSRTPRLGRAACAILLALFSVTCSGGGGSPATPTPQPSPTPVPPANTSMVGTWTGTLESSNFSTRVLTLEAFGTSGCIDGIWNSTPTEWAGGLSGTQEGTEFTGFITLERTGSNGARCTGLTTVVGQVQGDTLTLRGDGFSGDCAGGMPQRVAFVLQRQK